MKRLLNWLRLKLNPEPRFCVDCKWYNYDRGDKLCLQRTFQSIVTGETTVVRTRCGDQRESNHSMACGKRGRFFKPKE